MTPNGPGSFTTIVDEAGNAASFSTTAPDQWYPIPAIEIGSGHSIPVAIYAVNR